MEAIRAPDQSTAICKWWLRVDEQVDLLIDALAGRFRQNDNVKSFVGVAKTCLEDGILGEIYREAIQETASDVTDRLLHAAWESHRSMLEAAWQYSQGDIERPELDRFMGDTISAQSRLFKRLPLSRAVVDEKELVVSDGSDVDSVADNSAAVECHVTLKQMGAMVSREKRTIERLKEKGKLPAPDVKGKRGAPDFWKWSGVRQILEQEFGRIMPLYFPADKFTG